MARTGIAARFGDNLKRCRKRAGLSQEDLAFAAGLHRTEISLLERGMRLPRVDSLIKLAAGLSVPPEDLLDGIAWNPGSLTKGEFGIAGASVERASGEGD
jgi:transcriptional regulator with XRE-family HTH domain